jgi:hypothetical protein
VSRVPWARKEVTNYEWTCEESLAWDEANVSRNGFGLLYQVTTESHKAECLAQEEFIRAVEEDINEYRLQPKINCRSCTGLSCAVSWILPRKRSPLEHRESCFPNVKQ